MPNAISGIKFHKCSDPKYFNIWTRLLRRKNYTVTASTRVCSNHFKHGQPYKTDPHPTPHLTGYKNDQTKRRQLKRSGTPIQQTPKLPRKAMSPMRLAKDIAVQVDLIDLMTESQRCVGDHDYSNQSSNCTCMSITCAICSKNRVEDLEAQVSNMESECSAAERRLQQAKEEIKQLEESLKQQKRFSVRQIAHSDELIKMYTGIPSYEIFQWLTDQVRPHAQKLQYYRGKQSMDRDKFYQINNTTKPGPKRTFSIDDELLMTLMKLRLNLREGDIAFRFKVAQCTVSQILSTWIPFLARELEGFIYWPSQEETFRYYPQCFHKYKGCVRCIIDCTEIQIDRPSLAASNNQVYSQYKSRPTLKCLVGITPGGTISYISKPVGGSTSDKEVVKMTGIVEKFDKGDICMADRGFNIQELFLNKEVKLVIPPFTRTTNSTKQFTEAEDTATKTVANARIHVERAIGSLKEFDIMQGTIPLCMIDLMEAAFIVCSALVNLQPHLVPLTS